MTATIIHVRDFLRELLVNFGGGDSCNCVEGFCGLEGAVIGLAGTGSSVFLGGSLESGGGPSGACFFAHGALV
jgi:hypothetical protein